uniref:F-box domain-containing protein n=1 Tax=Caenorhabditis tropicalis TaxID=1561998 RepID=A0A1I7V411_9PELO
MSSPLYLFRLPQLVYINIINSMSTTDQSYISFCSRKTYSTIKHLARRFEKVVLDTYADHTVMFGDSTFRIKSNRKNQEISNEKVKINGQWVDCEVNTEFNMIGLFWEEDPLFGLMKSIEYVTDLFHTDISSMTLYENVDDRLLNLVQQRQRNLQLVKVYTDSSKNEIYDAEKLKNIIRSCTSEIFQLNARSSEELEIPNYYIKCNMFACLIGKWITLETVMRIDCEEIYLCETIFTVVELNRFLKHWINGGSPRLKTFYASAENNHYNELFDGIENDRKEETLVYQSTHGKYKLTFRRWYQIKRNDGVTAAVEFAFNFHYNRYFLQFAVWPVEHGNS